MFSDVTFNEIENVYPEPSTGCSTFCKKHWDKIFFAISVITATTQTIWTARKIYPDKNDTELWGAMKAPTFIYFATATYTVTYFISRLGKFYPEKKPETSTEEKSDYQKLTLFIKLICYLNALIKSASIISGCIDSQDSFFLDIVNGNLTAMFIVGGAFGLISAIGSFIATVLFYIPDAVKNAKIIAKDLSSKKPCEERTRDILAIILTLFSSVGYAIFYYLYMKAMTESLATDFHADQASDNVKIALSVSALVINTINNFFSSYQQNREIIEGIRLRNFKIKKLKILLSKLGPFGWLACANGLCDTFAGAYSGNKIANLDEYSLTLTVLAKISIYTYPLNYFTFYVIKGLLHQTSRFEKWAKARFFSDCDSTKEPNDDEIAYIELPTLSQ